jgi:hypothetical protein
MMRDFVSSPARGDETSADYLRLDTLPVRSQSTLTLP